MAEAKKSVNDKTGSTVALPRRSWWQRVMHGMSWYGLEVAVASIGLLVTAGVISYCIYTLVNHVAGIEGGEMGHYVGEVSLWIAAMMIVWLPVTLFFYTRSRNEMQRVVQTKNRMVHKVIVGLFLFGVIMMMIGFVFSIVYCLIRMAMGIDDKAIDTLVRVVVPGLLSVVTTSSLLFAFHDYKKLTRRVVMIFWTVIGAGLALVLLGVSAQAVKDNDRDTKAVTDLTVISDGVRGYYADKNALPGSLSDLTKLEAATKDRLYRYRYKKESDGHYQLCATFRVDTTKQYHYNAANDSGDNAYMSYADFGYHGTGEKCFKLRAEDSLYNYDKYGPGYKDTVPQSMY